MYFDIHLIQFSLNFKHLSLQYNEYINSFDTFVTTVMC